MAPLPALRVEPFALAGWSATRRVRLLAPAGPARPLRLRAGGAEVVAVPGRFSVSYLLVGAAQLVLVDAGSIADVDLIGAAAAALGRPIAHVVPTHLHFDHVFGVDAIASRSHATLLLGRRASELVATRPPGPAPDARQVAIFLRTWAWQGLPWLKPGEVKLALQRRVLVNCCQFATASGAPLDDGAPLPGVNGWRVLATPGHSDDSICLYHGASGLLVAGDTVRNFCGGEWNEITFDRARYRQTIATLRSLPIQAILPGHGPLLVGARVIERLSGSP